jgi:hypothetical protein
MKAERPAAAAQSACERLAQSRQRLRHALSTEPATLAGTKNENFGKPAADWLNGLKSIPGYSLAVEVAKAWWIKHPYRFAAVMVGDVAKAAVQPMAQRHPLGLVAGAFVVGGLLAWSRPWRWLPASVLVAALLTKSNESRH